MTDVNPRKKINHAIVAQILQSCKELCSAAQINGRYSDERITVTAPDLDRGIKEWSVVIMLEWATVEVFRLTPRGFLGIGYVNTISTDSIKKFRPGRWITYLRLMAGEQIRRRDRRTEEQEKIAGASFDPIADANSFIQWDKEANQLERNLYDE